MELIDGQVAGLGKGHEGSPVPHEILQSIDPKLAAARCDLGVAYFNSGKTEQAIKELKKTVTDKPDDAKAWYYLSSLYYNKAMASRVHRKKYLDLAVEGLKKAVKAKPDSSRSYLKLGKALRDRGDKAEAIKAFKESLRLDPNQREAEEEIKKLEK